MMKSKKVLYSLAVTFAIVVGALMMSGCNTNTHGATLGTNEEYKVLELKGGDTDRFDQILNANAKEGWRVRAGGWGNGFAFIIMAK